MNEQIFDAITLSSVYLTGKRIQHDGTEAGYSYMSGSLWEHECRQYIITNWHNVTGKNPETDEYIGSFTPTHFTINFKYVVPAEKSGKRNIMQATREVELYNDDGNKNWIEHPSGQEVDVVAIPVDLELPKEAQVKFINKQDYEDHWFPTMGDDCFIIGYPETFSGPGQTPIWKRGSVASLPLLNFDDKPVFLLDTIGNKGLSGAPVIGRGTGILSKGKVVALDTITGTWENFVGIYSGRLGDTGIESQLGRIWKKEVIDEIFRNI